jgi:intracellular multiplication protein IcmE
MAWFQLFQYVVGKKLNGVYMNKKSSLTGRNRFILILIGTVALIMVAFSVFNRTTSRPPAEVAPGASLSANPNVKPVPGTSTSDSYNELVQTDNERRAQQAASTGATSLPTLSNPIRSGALDPFDNRQQPPVIPPPRQQTSPPIPPPASNNTVRRPQSQRPDEERRRSVAAMEKQIESFVQGWKPQNSFGEFKYDSVEPEVAKEVTQAQTGQTGFVNVNNQLNVSAQGGFQQEGQSTEKFVRAGTIVPAVLLGAVNSDNPGPVLAQIVGGPLKGARVLGKFQLHRKHVVLEFNTLSWPEAERSARISAYGVNDDVSIGMATSVNNHYFLRYGLSLAAAFVEGYGDAIGRSNTTIVISPDGGVTESRGELTNQQIARTALGRVGQQFGSQLSKDANIPPTIKVDAQTPIGLLFMSDF